MLCLSRRNVWLQFVLFFSWLSLTFFPSSAHAVERGKATYALCSFCHGANGEGNVGIQAPAIAGLPEWYVTAQLKKFRDGVRGAHPQDIPGMRMRPMAKTLYGDDDVHAIATYVSQMPKTHPEQTVKGSVLKGQAAFAVCQACHGAEGAGNKDVNAPPIADLSDWYVINQLKAFKAGIRAGDPTKDPIGAAMGPMAKGLDDATMNNIAAYLNTFKK